MTLYDAFISYGRADSKVFATKLNESLKVKNFHVWFDQQDIPPAVDFQKQIDDGISKAENFLFIIAPHAVNSPYCLKEIELAVKLNKRIIPLLHVEQINYQTWQQRNPHKTLVDWEEYQKLGLNSSYPNMHPDISRIDWVYFRDIDNFDNSLNRLISAINHEQNYVRQHTQLLLKALEWEKNQKLNNYLLVGEEREAAQTWLKYRFVDQQPPCIPTDLHCEFICESIKNAENLLTQVFISFADQDHAIKDKIRKTLMRESLTIWTNKTDIQTGSKFHTAINQGIEGADNFVYLISKNSLQSEYCQQELDLALVNNKRIIPLLIENIDLNLIPDNLKPIQFIDFTQYQDDQEYHFSANQLLKEIKKDSSDYEKSKIIL
ncbi:MAG: toll/interleukin-1 receptor domain-containing protein, partial [Sphaerospermopsis sp. SIO1G2]|nr:toll/interleukin-1 receptor domain-containing protein [Sphaerospermopsis sp. SIO1G2]